MIFIRGRNLALNVQSNTTSRLIILHYLNFRVGQKNCTLRQSAITFLWIKIKNSLDNLKFLPFFYNDILLSGLKFYNEIPRSNKMTAI